jgi:hypothetical protein
VTRVANAVAVMVRHEEDRRWAVPVRFGDG